VIVATPGVGTATSGDKRRDRKGGAIGGLHGRVMEFLVHVLCQVEDVGHHFICGHEAVGVESVDDTLFGLTKMAGAKNATQYHESKVMRM
jgi:hypothetical protein